MTPVYIQYVTTYFGFMSCQEHITHINISLFPSQTIPLSLSVCHSENYIPILKKRQQNSFKRCNLSVEQHRVTSKYSVPMLNKICRLTRKEVALYGNYTLSFDTATELQHKPHIRTVTDIFFFFNFMLPCIIQ